MIGLRRCGIYTYIYIHNGISVIKKNEILPFATTWMDLEIIILSEGSQTEKDKYHIISLISGHKKTKQRTNKTQVKLTLRQRENKGDCQRIEG